MQGQLAIGRAGLSTGTGGASGNLARRKLLSGLMGGLCVLSAFAGVALLLAILLYVTMRGLPALNPAFFTERPLPYGEVGGGVAPAIVGSLLMLAVAAAIGLPIGMATAMYLVEGPGGRFADLVRFVVDLMAGLPSIVVGVFVWTWLVRQLVGNFSGLAGGVALALIMIPIVTRATEEMLRLVPGSLREASYALGVPVWKTVLLVVIPAAKGGIVTGIMLSLARAGGETAPLLLTALGNQFFNFNLLEPMAALPIQIYTYAVSPYEDWHTKAWGSSLVLIAVIAAISLATRVATRKRW